MKKISQLKSWLRIALFIVPTAYAINFLYAVSTNETGGTFGDTFGAANALFSGTALLMLVLAVIMQREELEIVKQERNDTRELLKGQDEINKLQKAALERQVFEQTFNSLLDMALNEKARLTSRPIVDGRVQLSTLTKSSESALALLNSAKLEELENRYGPIWRQSAVEPQFYINLLFRLATLIDDATIEEVQKVSLRQLLISTLDVETCSCICWFAIENAYQGKQIEKFESFLEFYQISKMLNSKQEAQVHKLFALVRESHAKD